MKVKKEKLYLTNLDETSKNPPPNKYVLVYTEDEDEDKPVNKPKKKKYTLNQIGDMVVSIKDDLKEVNTRLDYIVKANDLKDLPKSK